MIVAIVLAVERELDARTLAAEAEKHHTRADRVDPEVR